MQVTITSDGIIAICATISLLGGMGLWAVKSIVSAELRKLNGTYVYAKGSDITGHQIEKRLDALEAKKGTAHA